MITSLLGVLAMPWIDKASLIIALAAIGLALALVGSAVAVVGRALIHQLLYS